MIDHLLVTMISCYGPLVCGSAVYHHYPYVWEGRTPNMIIPNVFIWLSTQAMVRLIPLV